MLVFQVMKIAVTGKGGVGKTTLAAALCQVFSAEGKKVLAVDADPDANLATALGLSPREAASIRPIAEMTDLIEQRTGARPGSSGGMFKLNPQVDDIPEGFGKKIDNIILLVTGRSKEAASGCYCPENVFLRQLLKHLMVKRGEVVIIDMEAGIEHLTRGTAEAVDAFLVVVEPGLRSIQTAHTVKELAKGLGVGTVKMVASKVRGPEDLDFIKQAAPDMELAGAISYNPAIIEADMKAGQALLDATLLSEAKKVRQALETA